MPYRVRVDGGLGQTERPLTDRDGEETYAVAFVTPDGQPPVSRAELLSALAELVQELRRIRIGLSLAIEQDLESIS